MEPTSSVLTPPRKSLEGAWLGVHGATTEPEWHCKEPPTQVQHILPAGSLGTGLLLQGGRNQDGEMPRLWVEGQGWGGAGPRVQDSSESCSADVCMVSGSSPVLQSPTPSPTPTPTPTPSSSILRANPCSFCPATAASPGQKQQIGSVSQQREAHKQRTGSKGTW